MSFCSSVEKSGTATDYSMGNKIEYMAIKIGHFTEWTSTTVYFYLTVYYKQFH